MLGLRYFSRMLSAAPDRLIRVDAHDDGVNRWEMARLKPAAALAGQVTSYSDYWEETGGFTTRREMPSIDPVLIVNLGEPIEIVDGNGDLIILRAGEGFAGGLHLRHALARSNGRQAGVHVHLPLQTLGRLLRLPLADLVDRTLPLDVAAGEWGRTFCSAIADARTHGERAALLDTMLTDRLAAAPPDPLVGHLSACLEYAPEVKVADLARRFGWSRKHLSTRFREATGVSPRLYRRLARFGRLTNMLQSGARAQWAALALDAGYFDQPHMLRDFRDFAGVTPREFIARSLPNMGGLIES
jgi:AraC-like DNA-binding protein